MSARQASAALSIDERSRRVAIGAVLATLVGAVLVTLRHEGPSVLDSMWAEDGSVFVEQSFQREPVAALLHPYRGYVHVLSRVIATIASIGPIDLAATVMSGSAALIVGGIAYFVYVASASVISSRGLRALLAGSVVLTPVARIESLSNVSNLHFYLVFAAFWALIWIPRRRLGGIACCVVVALAALGNPLVVLLVPVAVIRWRGTPDWMGRAPVVVGAVALGIQAMAVITAGADPGAPAPTSPEPLAIAVLYPIRVIGGALLGLRWTWDLWGLVGGWLIVAGALALAGGVTFIATRGAFPHRPIVLLSLGLSVAFFVVSLWVRWNPALAPTADDQFLRQGVRYLLLPVLLVMTAIAILLDQPDPRVSAGAWRAGTSAVIVLILVTWFVDLAGPNARTGTPSWTETVAASRAGCSADPTSSAELAIAPSGWSMTLPCAVLLPASPPRE